MFFEQTSAKDLSYKLVKCKEAKSEPVIPSGLKTVGKNRDKQEVIEKCRGRDQCKKGNGRSRVRHTYARVALTNANRR